MSEKEWIDIFGDNLADMLFDARMTQRERNDFFKIRNDKEK